MHNNKFLQWYRDNFDSCAAVASFFQSEIAETAKAIGAEWSNIKDKVTWNEGERCKVNATGSMLIKGCRNSVGIYASVERDKNGVSFPLITFKNKGGAGDTEVFNGLSFLWEEFKRHKGDASQEQLEQWNKKKREREEKAARQQEAAQRQQEAEQKRRAANVQKELQIFDQLPRAASFVYTDKKLIPSVLEHVDARSGSDKHGNYIALRLHNINGEPLGVQRIYDRNITKADGSKTNKDFTWGMDKNAAHMIIGDIQSAERVYVVEGFATGASVFLAMMQLRIPCAVIVALDSGNMVKVVNEYRQKKPYIDLMLAVDNDMWKQRHGKGNAGMLVAINLLAEHDDLKAYAPNFDKVDPCYQPTDWNDLHVRAGLKEVMRQMKGHMARVKCSGDLFERQLQRLAYIAFRDTKQVMNECITCATVGMQVGMPKYKPSDVLGTIRTVANQVGIPKDRINLKKLKNKITKMFNAQVREAQGFRSFSSRITDDKLRPDHIEYHKFNKTVIDDEVLNFVRAKQGIIIIRAPMGSKKTNYIIKPTMWEYQKSLFTAHRISLIGGAVEALNRKPRAQDLEDEKQQLQKLMQFGPIKEEDMQPLTSHNLTEAMKYGAVFNYQEQGIKEMMSGVQKLASCINSVLKAEFAPLLNNLDAVCVDEAAQTLRHVTAGGAIKYPVAVFDRWLSLMATTREKVILADADANDLLVDFCELGLKQRNAHLQSLYGEDVEPQKIHVIELVTDCSDINVLYTDGDTAFKKAIDDVEAGHRVMVACDSANTAEKLFTQLQSKYPEKKGLFISLDTKEDKEVDEFTDAPDEKSLKYDYLVYSPSISSGVSFEKGHFNKHYGIFCGTVAPSDAIQMMRRDRLAREFVLGLDTMHSNREESAMAMWLGMILANDNQLDVELNRESGKIELKTDNLDFDRIRLDLIAQENRAKNNFAKNLILSLYADGYQINSLDCSEIDKEKGQSEKEAARDLLKAIDMNRHLEQTTPTDAEYMELEQRTNVSRDDKARMNRWKIENLLMMKVDEDSVEFHHKGGLSKVRLFELLNMSPEKAREFDEKEATSDVHPSQRLYLVKQRQALRDFFEVAGFDWKTGQGQATEESLTAAIKHLIDGDKIHLFNNWYQFGGYINPLSRKLKPVNKAKAIVEAMGLKMDTKQLGRCNNDSVKRQRYSINESTWSTMAAIQTRRVDAETTAFKFDLLDAALIHSSSDNYIEQEEKMDHAETKQIKASSWIVAIKQALENLRIPMEYAPKIMTEISREGAIRKKVPSEGVQAFISGIYQRMKGMNPAIS